MENKKVMITQILTVFLFFSLCFWGAGKPSASQAASGEVSAALSPAVIVEADPAIYPPQEEVPVSQAVRVTFNKNMDQATTRSAFALYRISGAGEHLLVDGICQVTGNVLTFTPFHPLAADSIYQVALSLKATDASGQNLQGIQNTPPAQGDILWYFVTVADAIPPEITDCSPASEDRDISPPTEIRFHVRDNNAGVDPGSLAVKINGQQVAPVLSPMSKKDLQVVYSPDTPFPYGERITVSIYARDYVGNPVEQSYSFTTMSRPDRSWSLEHKALTDVAALAIDSQDQLWVALRQGPDGSTGGVRMFDGSRWHLYASAGEVFIDNATAIAVDSRDQVWVGLGTDEAAGDDPNAVPKLAKYNGQNWTLYTAKALGVSSEEEINEIAVDFQNHLWIATSSSGVIEFDGNFSLPRGLEDTGQEDIQVRAIAPGPDNDIWVGTDLYGVLRLGAVGGWVQYAFSVRGRDPVDFIVNDLAVGTDGKVWAATSSGLLQLSPDDEAGGGWKCLIPNNFVHAVAVDRRSGNIWIGTERGLLRLDSQSNQVNFLPDEPYYPLAAEAVTHIAINPNPGHPEIWVAGTDSLARRDENAPRIISSLPKGGAQNVAENTSITIYFSEAMDPNSRAFFNLYDSRHKPVSGSAIIDGDTLTFALPPGASLLEGETYTLIAASQMQDLAGNRLDGDRDGLGGEPEDTCSLVFTVEKKAVPLPSSEGWLSAYSGGWSGAGFGFPGSPAGLFGTQIIPLNPWSGLSPMSGFSSWSVFNPLSGFDSQFQNNWGASFGQGISFNQFGFQGWSSNSWSTQPLGNTLRNFLPGGLGSN
ncbi:MAG: Ig-like domain-containing protein [bacterium]